MTTKKISMLSKILISILLRLHGWRPHKLSDGTKGWRKRLSPRCTRTGPTEYAITYLLK